MQERDKFKINLDETTFSYPLKKKKRLAIRYGLFETFFEEYPDAKIIDLDLPMAVFQDIEEYAATLVAPKEYSRWLGFLRGLRYLQIAPRYMSLAKENAADVLTNEGVKFQGALMFDMDYIIHKFEDRNYLHHLEMCSVCRGFKAVSWHDRCSNCRRQLSIQRHFNSK